MIKTTFSTSNSLRLAISVAFAAAALITFAAYSNDSSGTAHDNSSQENPAIYTLTNTRSPAINNANRRNLTLDTGLMHRAAEAVRLSLNSERLRQCSSVPAYRAVDDIKYAKRDYKAHGIDRYSMEIVFDDAAAVFVSVERAWNLTAERFVVTSSVPSPCDSDLSEQLAVSMTGWSAFKIIRPICCHGFVTLFFDRSGEHQQPEAPMDRCAQSGA